MSGNESDAVSPESVTGSPGWVTPGHYALYQTSPNPFNPTTVIDYDAPEGGGIVTLQVFDVNGQLVRTLVDARHVSGRQSVTWDARDNHGAPVATGVYFYRLKAPGFTKTKKMVLLQ